jgi:hypothetical protein
MPWIRTLAVAALLACALPALAQQASTQPIEQQMSADEFKAAGLDKLTPEELARLNAWLGRTISTETTKAAAAATEEVKQKNRGFFDFGSDAPITGRIAGDFHGFAKGRTYTLENGQVWQQIDDADLPGVRLTNPDVLIKPAMVGNTWYMAVGKYHTRAQVRRVK